MRGAELTDILQEIRELSDLEPNLLRLQTIHNLSVKAITVSNDLLNELERWRDGPELLGFN